MQFVQKGRFIGMKLNKIFTSHMVFPSGKPIRVYGEGKGSASVSFAGKTVQVMSDRDEWCIELGAMDYGGPYEMTVTLNNCQTLLEDIYIGEVYVVAGQSNMQFKLKESTCSKEAYKTNELLRFFVADRIEEGEPFNSDDGWQICREDMVGNLSALGYLAGNDISIQKGVAVGIICCYQGASVIESWVPEKTFSKLGIDIAPEQKRESHYCEEYSKWNKEGTLYTKMLSQIVPYSVSAIVWYQGESDASAQEGKVYAKELAALIDIWREQFKNRELPFVVVQLADIDEQEGIDHEGWKLVQKAQIDIQNMRENVKTVVCSDVCEAFDIHPPTKDKLAKRISKAL